jgi:Heparinase II/III-like protein/Heparinase II/III N-terminus
MQEVTNLRWLAAAPSLQGRQAVIASFFPKPLELRFTPFAQNIRVLADRILEHRFPLFASEISTGPEIEWRRDYVNNIATAPSYFRTIPYLNARRAGDHKWIWELNRHQHLIALAQAHLLFGDVRYLNEIESELCSWMEQNPFQRGINWASALEVAFRAMSWIWVFHLVGPQLSDRLRHSMVEGLYRHGLHIENNLSIYFSPNTHLLGEAVALHALGVLLPALPAAARWKRHGAQVVEAQMQLQVREDGSHFEQSSYYHLYAFDMLLFHAVLASPSEMYRNKLSRMADYLEALLGPDRCLPFIADDDGGRWFHPYGERARFARASLASANAYFGHNRWQCEESDYWEQACWWLPAAPTASRGAYARSQVFQAAGIAVMRSQKYKIVVDCGPFGRGSAGHSHADTLSITIASASEEIAIDPGTFTYVGSFADRNSFRGTATHNTVCVDGLDQADPVNPFRWKNPPAVSLSSWRTSDIEDMLEAECAYRGLRHRRYVHFVKPFALLIVDTVDGPPGKQHRVQQRWHLAADRHAARFCFLNAADLQTGWRSRCFGQREPIPVLVSAVQTALPVTLPAAIPLSDDAEITIMAVDTGVRFRIWIASENREIVVNYQPNLR